ncbi:MAG: hypothetical protein ACPGO5_03800 [Patescibacteria group bacterium]
MIMSLVMGTAVFSSDAVEGMLQETRNTRRAADAYQISVALSMYYDDHKHYPVVEKHEHDAWAELKEELEPKYIQDLPNDPQIGEGMSYDYESDGYMAKIQYVDERTGEVVERWSY